MCTTDAMMANELYKYARDNRATWKGLHFFFVGSDSVSNRSLNPLSLQKGDIVLANWDGNTSYDHAMIVTGINYSLFVWNKYDRILVTYQNGEKGPELHRSLQYVIDKNHKKTNKWATSSVYRPIDYNQAGK